MTICDGGRHDDIVYEGRTCPLCELIDVRDNLEARIEELENQVDGLEFDLAGAIESQA
jgi:hypothetical protein